MLFTLYIYWNVQHAVSFQKRQSSKRRWCHPLITWGQHFDILKIDSSLKVPLLWHENHGYICDTSENKWVHFPPRKKIQAPKSSKVRWKCRPTLTSIFYIFYLLYSSINSIRVTGIPTSHEVNSELRVMQHTVVQMGMLLKDWGLTLHIYRNSFYVHPEQQRSRIS